MPAATQTESDCRAQYIANLSKCTRNELLSLCRRGGLTAHKIKTVEGLAELLWNHFGRDQYLFQAAKARAFA